MAAKINLPHKDIVVKWKEEKVIKWLKRVHLDDCISAFEVRHIDGIKLLAPKLLLRSFGDIEDIEEYYLEILKNKS